MLFCTTAKSFLGIDPFYRCAQALSQSIPNISWPQQETCAFSSHVPISFSPQPSQLRIYLLSVDLPILDIACTGNHIIWGLLCLASFSLRNGVKDHPRRSVGQCFVLSVGEWYSHLLVIMNIVLWSSVHKFLCRRMFSILLACAGICFQFCCTCTEEWNCQVIWRLYR